MRIVFATAVGIGLLTAATWGSAAPRVGQLTEFTAPGIVLLRDGPDSRIRHIARHIAQLDKTLPQVFDFAHEQVAYTPMRIFMIDSHLWRSYLRPSEGVTTDFIPHRFANYLVLTEGRRQDFAGEFFYSYTQGWLANHLRGAYPLWLEEGIAAQMEVTTFRRRTAWLDRLEAEPFSLWFPTREMLRIERNSRAHLSVTTAATFHWQSWVMMNYGARRDPGFGAQIHAYLNAINNLETIDAAVEKSFGMSVDELDAHLRTRAHEIDVPDAKLRKVRNLPYPLPRVTIGEVTPVQFSAGRKLAKAEVLEAIADLMLVGRKPVNKLRRLVAAHEELDGGPRSRVLRLRLAIANRQPSEVDAALVALEPHHATPEIARAVGVALRDHLERTTGSMSDTRAAALRDRAFELLDRALVAQADDPEAAWSYAMLAAELRRELPKALARLERAERVLPGNFHVAEARSLVHLASGNRDALASSLEEAANRARTLDQRRWALQLIAANK